MFNGGGEIEQITMPVQISTAQLRHTANVRIIEQPASKALRFRYECEGRSAGSIPGASSTPENKTFPAIRVEGYQGRAVVVVSCVTKDAPHRPHPHNLVGREGCKKGVCTLEIPPETMTVTFSNLGIQCVKKRDIENALRVREEIRVDPFRTGFGHRNQPTSIDLNSVRLCFQVFLEGDRRGKFTVPLTPVVSEPIYDKKAMCDLVIVKLSDCVSYVDGGRKDIILLCEKVAKEDIQVRFFEEIGGNVVWEGLGDFQPSQVHKQTAIWFRTPRYKTLDVTEPVKVFIQLRRPSDGATSEALPFELLPLDSEPGMLKRKRHKFDDTTTHMLRQLQEQERANNQQYMLNIPLESVKTEPRDNTPSPYAGQVCGGISPMYAASPEMPTTYRLPMDMIQTPSPEAQYLPNRSTPPMSNVLPPIRNVLQQNWNIPYPTNTSDMAAAVIETNELSLYNLDSQQTELRPINLNSGELASLSMFDTNNLSETFTNNLSLTDVAGIRQDENMTDSLTRLANNTIDKICQGNNFK